MSTHGYSHGEEVKLSVNLCTLKFLQRVPLLWLRPRDGTFQSAFEEAEAAKRELATLIDMKVGQLKFANAKELKTQFHASKTGRAANFFWEGRP